METDTSRVRTQSVVDSLPLREQQEPGHQPHHGRRVGGSSQLGEGLWGRACAPPGRCQGLHNGAPGVGTRPAHSAPNNHCSTAAGPAASRGGWTAGQQMGLSMVVPFHGSPVKHCEPHLWHGKPLTSHSEAHRLCLSAALPPRPGQLVTQPGKDT